MTNDCEVSVVLSQPKEKKDSFISFPNSTVSTCTTTDSFQVSLPSYPIQVVKRYHDWCILSVARGKGPRALEEWIASNERLCFDQPSCSQSPCDDSLGDADHRCDEAGKGHVTNIEQGDERRLCPTLVNPHNAACAHSLVLATRHPSFLKELTYLRVTAHCLVKGHHPPGTELQLSNVIEGKSCRTDAICLEVIPSNSIGHISLLATCVEHYQSTSFVPRQVQRHLQAGGWPVLGATRDCHPFRGEKMCLSVVGLDFEVNGLDRRQSVFIPPVPRLRNVLNKEGRFWRQRQGVDDIHMDRTTVSNEIPIPTEYIQERAIFDGLEFRVTPVAMIPRKGTEALVDIVDGYFSNKEDLGREPMLLDLGTGCGNILLAILKRLGRRNARGVGLDAMTDTLDLCAYNAAALGLSDRANFIQGRFADIQLLQFEPFDVVVCNPPYMTKGGRRNLDAATTSYEPEKALFVDRNDPNIHYQHVLDGLIEGNLLVSGALLVFEVCKENAEAIKQMMIDRGFTNVKVGRDWKACIRTVEGLFNPTTVVESAR